MNSADPVIAVVDDESPVRIMLGRVLRLADYRVITFASGEAFLDSLTARLPACTILDVHMPGLTGLELLSRMRAARIAIPVIFITASDDIALDRLALDARAVCLLRKPFSSDNLLEAVGRALQGGPPETPQRT